MSVRPAPRRHAPAGRSFRAAQAAGSLERLLWSAIPAVARVCIWPGKQLGFGRGCLERKSSTLTACGYSRGQYPGAAPSALPQAKVNVALGHRKRQPVFCRATLRVALGDRYPASSWPTTTLTAACNGDEYPASSWPTTTLTAACNGDEYPASSWPTAMLTVAWGQRVVTRQRDTKSPPQGRTPNNAKHAVGVRHRAAESSTLTACGYSRGQYPGGGAFGSAPGSGECGPWPQETPRRTGRGGSPVLRA